jgi:glycosyltransferase involved in cell wall biosynthesis
MISRKGLPSLLSALSRQAANTNGWILWIEGDGPELDRYIALAKELGLKECCRFLGFCQYDLHSWLIRSSDIVVVPSLWDTWGIVVDEGIQLGKAVISSDVTGSGYDRIDHGDNGFIFPAGNIEVLAELLSTLVNNTEQRLLIAEKAKSNSKNIRPLDNLNIVLEITNK